MRSYEIEVSLNSEALPEDYTLALNDIPLDPIGRRGLVRFAFDMEFYAGDLRISISRGDRVIVSSDVQVDPDIAKLTRDEYAAMVADIASATLALYRLSAVTVPASSKPEGLRSDLVTLELIRANFVGFERAVSRIADQPMRSLRSTSVETDIMRARRVDDRAIGMAMRTGTPEGGRDSPRLPFPAQPRCFAGQRRGHRDTAQCVSTSNLSAALYFQAFARCIAHVTS
jgi:Domain of unknown function (DUF2357)